MKTRRGAAKRFKVTGSGKIVMNRANMNHMLAKKTPKRKRRLRKDTILADAEVKRVKKMIAS